MSGTTTTTTTTTTAAGNTLEPPPRLTGDTRGDIVILKNYVDDLYRKLALEQNIVGTQIQNVTNITNLGSSVTNLTTVVDGVGRTYDTRTAAVLAAAAGEIPVVLTSLRTQGYASVGDDGAAAYAWQATAPSWAGDDPNNLLHFPETSARGGYWVLVESEPHFAMAGVLGNDLGVEPTTDYAGHFPAMAAYSEAIGGCAWHYGARNYLFDSTCAMTAKMGIVGQAGQGREPDHAGAVDTVESVLWQPGISINEAASITVTDSCYMDHVCLRRKGIPQHTNLQTQLDAQKDFAGTLIAKGGGGDASGCSFRHVRLWGAAIGIYGLRFNGAELYDIYGDCTTMAVLSRAGETKTVQKIKRKPLLTNNQFNPAQTINVSGSLFDSSGMIGVTVAESLSAAGLTTGQRVAIERLPAPYPEERLTVEVLTDTTFRFIDTVWDAAYASYDTSESNFTFLPGAAWGLQASGGVYETSGGKIGARIRGTGAVFQVGHYLAFSARGLPQSSFTTVLTRVSSTDYELDIPWPTDPAEEAALLALGNQYFELAAMPTMRLHTPGTAEATIVYDLVGNYNGWGIINISGAGSFLEGAMKGGSGIVVGDGSSTVNFRVESGTTGELEVDAPGGEALRITASRVTVFGYYKSNSIGVRADFGGNSDRATLVGIEAVDNRTAAIHQSDGNLVALAVTTRNAGKTIFEDISSFTSYASELRPEDATGIGAFPDRDLERTHWEYAEAETWYRVHTRERVKGWDAGVLVDLYTLDATDGMVLDVPISAPNIEVPFTATATTTGTTTQALTSTGTAAAGTDSGYSISTNNTVQMLRIEIVAQEAGGRECAVWDLRAILSRGSPASQTELTRTGGLTGITPTEYYDNSGTDPSTWAVTLSKSSQNFRIDATGSAGKTLNWKARITALEVT